MHRFKEIGVLSDHSQIPVVLARQTQTRELLALQRIPLSVDDEEHYDSFCSDDGDGDGENGHEHEQQEKLLVGRKNNTVSMADLLARFPFIEIWASIPRHPCSLMLREVIVEGSELFLVSERYSETLVRYLRRQGVVARNQVRNHAMNTPTDEKHDRASGALLERWISEGCVPDVNGDARFREALGMQELVDVLPGVAKRSSSNAGVAAASVQQLGHSGVWVRDSGIHFLDQQQQQQQQNQSPKSVTSLARQGSTTGAVIDAAYDAALTRKVSSVDVTREQSAGNNNNNMSSRSRSDIFDPHGASDPATGAGMLRQNRSSALFGATASTASFLGAQQNSSGSDSHSSSDDDTDLFGESNVRLEEEISKAIAASGDSAAQLYARNVATLAVAARANMESNKSRMKRRGSSISGGINKEGVSERRRTVTQLVVRPVGSSLDVVPDFHPLVRYADIYRVPLCDEEVRLVLFQLLSALESLHGDGGVAHGSVSPRNIVLAQRGNLCTLRLTNFRNVKKIQPAAAAAGTRENSGEAAAGAPSRPTTSDTVNTALPAVGAIGGKNLKRIIEDAIQASLDEIQEEEEWRKRRKSLYVPLMSPRKGGGASLDEIDLPKQQKQQLQRKKATTERAVPLGQQRNSSSQGDGAAGAKTLSFTSPTLPLTRKSSFEQFRTRGSRPLSPTSARNTNAALGREVMASWNNDDEESDLAKMALREAGEWEDYEDGGDSSEEDKAGGTLGDGGVFATAAGSKSNLAKIYKRHDVQRWVETVYAAPEVMLEYQPQPSPAGDIWSAAVIALEMVAARPLVYGTTSRDCFFRAAALCGCPSNVVAPDFHRWALHVTRAQLPERGIRATPLKSVAPLASDEAVDLLSKILVLDPSKRLSASEALKHAFFSALDE